MHTSVLKEVEKPMPQDTLNDLLSQCDPTAPSSDEDKEWTNSKAEGLELI